LQRPTLNFIILSELLTVPPLVAQGNRMNII
jgi:hypothetical protein